MSDINQILLVEGDSDKSFFSKICKKLDLNTTVQVASPKDVGGNRNSKEGVFNRLDFLLKELRQGRKTHIAIIVDADYKTQHGLGCEKTIDRVAKIAEQFGFTLKTDTSHHHGLYFEHADGLADFGLWVMPNNKQEGMLEDWIKSCIKVDEKPLFQHAQNTISGLSNPKFKPHLTSKAEIATWLAWQKTPAHGLYTTINDDLLDENNILFTNLCQWLKNIFP